MSAETLYIYLMEIAQDGPVFTFSSVWREEVQQKRVQVCRVFDSNSKNLDPPLRNLTGHSLEGPSILQISWTSACEWPKYRRSYR